MCGRYSLAPDESVEIARIVAEVQARFGATSIHTGDIYPTNAAPVLLSNGQEMTPKPMGWGFPSFKGKGVIINARGETALDKPMFRKSLLERRCIVPTTGFLSGPKTRRSTGSTCRVGTPSTWPASGTPSRGRSGMWS